MIRPWLGMLIAFALMAHPSPAQQPGDDEAQSPAYELPELLRCADGSPVATPDQWPARRAEILRLFEDEMFGRAPGKPESVQYDVTATDPQALHGKATRKEITITLAGNQKKLLLHLLLYLPNHAPQPAPAFLALNFGGNHAITNDPAIPLSESWQRDDPARGYVNHRATEASRGKEAGRWPLELILDRGYALATLCYHDVDPDFDDGFQNGAHALFARDAQKPREPNEWGAIAAWAWGCSRALDYLLTEPQIDGRRVAIMGHSRLGKTALWAGAADPRFALVISNNSGCGGAALSRREFGETVKKINASFPHWFCGAFKKYGDHVDQLPFDQHQLIALMAPRPVYVASAVEDRWADPLGEFLSAKHAGPVYELFGLPGLPTGEMPAVDHPVAGTIGYHIRRGKHDVTRYDWEQFLNFADSHLRPKSP